jgi:hypothetical protein
LTEKIFIFLGTFCIRLVTTTLIFSLKARYGNTLFTGLINYVCCGFRGNDDKEGDDEEAGEENNQ